MSRFLILLILLFSPLGAEKKVDQSQHSSQSSWKGFEKVQFKLEDTFCFIVKPKQALNHKPWVWRTSLPNYHSELDIELLKQGYHIAYINVVVMLGADVALDLMDTLYQHLTQKKGFHPKPALEAVSRGGRHAYRYASRHPDKIACIYADVPVMDLKSWPLAAGAKKQVQDAIQYYNFDSENDLKTYQGNYLDLLPILAKAKIPMRHVITLNDEVVPAKDNSLKAKTILNQHQWDIDLVVVPNAMTKSKGHHFSPFYQLEESLQFIKTHTSP